MAVQTVYALFLTVYDAERAIGALTDHGVLADTIGVMARHPEEEYPADQVRQNYERVVNATETSLGEPVASYRYQNDPPAGMDFSSPVIPHSSVDTPENVEVVGKTGITTTTVEDAKAGAAIGTGVGFAAGLLAAAAAITIPGAGLILAGGALAGALGVTLATTAAGAITGGVTGYLRDMGMPDQAVELYADRLQEGNYLVSVIIDSSDYDKIKEILLKYNAVGVDLDLPYAAAPSIREIRGEPVDVSEPISSQAPLQFDANENWRTAAMLNNEAIEPLPHSIITTEQLDGTPRDLSEVTDDETVLQRNVT